MANIIRGLNTEILYRSKRSGELYKILFLAKKCDAINECYEVIHYKTTNPNKFYTISEKLFQNQFEPLSLMTEIGIPSLVVIKDYLESIGTLSESDIEKILTTIKTSPKDDLGLKVIHIKTGNEYVLKSISLNCTNGMEMEYSVQYTNFQGMLFSRNTLKEFFTKFEVA